MIPNVDKYTSPMDGMGSRIPIHLQFPKKVTSEASPRCVLFSEIQGEEAERREVSTDFTEVWPHG